MSIADELVLNTINLMQSQLQQACDPDIGVLPSELENILTDAVDQAPRLLNVDACTVSLVDETAAELLLCAQRGLRFSYLGACTPLGHGAWGRVIRTGQTLVAGGSPGETNMLLAEFAREKIRAVALAPMRSHRQIVGVLGVMRHTPQPFGPDQIELLEWVAHHIGEEIENSRLYQSLRQHAVELEEAYNQLQESDHLKREMIQNISHELRTPLAIILGHTELLRGGDLGPLTSEQIISLDVVERKTRQLGHLVEQMVTLEAVTAETLGNRPLDLGKLVHMAVEDCRSIAMTAGIQLRIEIEEDLPQVMGDSWRLNQVMDNLLSNAIKFTPQGGVITVRVKPVNDRVEIQVADTGIGIPAAKIARLFERFYQVDGSARRRYSGMGLGLAIVKQIVESHGGQVRVESREGQGSTFFVDLPQTGPGSRLQSPRAPLTP